MRVSVPTIPRAALAAPAAPPLAPAAAAARVAAFVRPGGVAVLTGAGVSVDSGIRAYRGHDGRYMNPNYKPIFYHELVADSPAGAAFRRRYWLRSFMGYPHIRRTRPNPTHYALAALQHAAVARALVTQNVDGLHRAALAAVWPPARIDAAVLELHGTLLKVHCSRGHTTPRDAFQTRLAAANPRWAAYADELARTGERLRTNPDGDVELGDAAYDDFVVPECPECMLEHRHNNVHKPEIVFFGESIPPGVKDRALRDIERCDRLLMVGTTLATFSAFRLLKHALARGMPVLHLNLGPSRADGLPGVDKVDIASGAIIRDVAKAVIGPGWADDGVVRRLLTSGVVKPPEDDRDDAPAPVAAAPAAAAGGS